MKLDIYNTHMELYPYKKGDYPVIEDMYTAVDSFTQDNVSCGYIIENRHMYLPRGTDIHKIEKITGANVRYIRNSDPFEMMNRKHYPLYDPRDKIQEEAIKFMKLPDHQVGINLMTGGGKSIPNNTLIPTPNGYIKMGDIKVGDYVFGSNGKPTKVIGVYPQESREVYEITFSDRRKVKCGAEHLWAVNTQWNPKYKILSTVELLANYKQYSSYLDNTGRDPYNYIYRIPLLSGPVEYEHQDVPVDPYVVGALIGNGCLTYNNLVISSGDDYVPNKIAKICGFSVKYPTSNYDYRFYRKNGFTVHTESYLTDIPEIIGYSRDKVIPDCYMYNDVDTRIRLLQGLMDTDGSICNHDECRYNVTYSSCSKKLLEQIQELIWGFGFIANIYEDKRVEKYVGGYHGSLNIRVPQWFKPLIFTHPKKHRIAMDAAEGRKDLKQKYKYLKIKNIKRVEDEDCTCIKVDAPDSLYLTEDFIVTHNTYCVANASSDLNEKTIIITPNDGLKKQWIKTYKDMFEYKTDEILNIVGTDIIERIMNGDVSPADVYVVNHQTLNRYINTKGGFALHNFFKEIKVGVKVYDESHLNFMNILLIDFFSNTDRTWYLTATFDRSDKSESRCFKRAFNSVITYGEEESRELVPKHVIYHVVNINSHISYADRRRVIGWKGMSAASYGKYCYMVDKNETMYKTVVEILKKLDKIDGKILILTPLIEAVDKVVEKLKKEFPDKVIGGYHSKMNKDEKENSLNGDIIVSTLKSCGTGKDIKGLRAVINTEAIASKINAEQMIGRLRPFKDEEGNLKDTYFFDVVDTCITPANYWFKARFKRIQELVKDIIMLTI